MAVSTATRPMMSASPVKAVTSVTGPNGSAGYTYDGDALRARKRFSV
jgi:hypothetical protein